MRTHVAVLALAAALILPFHLAAWVTAPAGVAPPLPVVGAWTLNRNLSSAPPEPGSGGGGRPAGGRGRFGGGTSQPSDTDRLRRQATLRRMREAPERLTITYDGRTVAFADGDGRTWKATTDGKKQTILTGEGEIDLKARVDGEQLIVEEKISGKATLIYTYAAVTDAGVRRLSIRVALEGNTGSRGTPELTRVYDAAP